MKHASNAAPKATKNTITYVQGSDAETPNSIDDIQRVKANAPAKPMTAPMNVSVIPSRSTIDKITGRRAPSAMRMPISCVRNVIE